MSPRRLLCFSLIASLLGGTACNEIIGAGRYGVADGATGLDAARPDASDLDAGEDTGPGFDAGECEPVDLETYYLDDDGDDFGRDDSTVEACSLPMGYADQGGDCDDDVDTAYPGASEVCDEVDSDCDGTIDEGLMGPVGAAFEIIPSTDAGNVLQSAVAAYSGGFLAVSGAGARWLDETGMPDSDVFRHATSVTSGDKVAVIVYEDTSPPRGVTGLYDESGPWVVTRAYSAVETGTSLSGITALTPPTDPPFSDVNEMDLVRIGDQIAVLAAFTGGDDDALLRVATIDPLLWMPVGSFDEFFVNSYYGALAVDSVPASALLGLTIFTGITREAEAHWMSAGAGGFSIDTTPALALGSGTRIYVPSAPVGVDPAGETLIVVDDGILCLHRIAIPVTGGPIVLGACPGAITWEPLEMHIRQGVVSILTTDGFREEPLAAGTTGSPHVLLTIPGSGPRMAIRDNHGLIVYWESGALRGQSLGCQPPP